jgi:hypothetical protein
MMLSIDLTGDTAQAVLWALREHRNNRSPVREYVDKHYAGMDEPFRNRKIGEVQDRLDRLLSLENRLLTKLAQASAPTGRAE